LELILPPLLLDKSDRIGFAFTLIQPSPSGEGFKRNAFEQKAPAVKRIVD